MKKFIVLPLLALFALSLSLEARTVRDFFADEPGDLFALLPRTVRLDLIDYYDNGTIVRASNNLGNSTRLDTLTDNFLRMHTSDVKTVELRLMRFKSDTIIAVIETIELPAPDSRITFYNKHWYRLKEIKPFKMPTMEDFVLPNIDKAKRRELLEGLAFRVIELRFEGQGHEQLVARHGLDRFLSKEEWSKLKPCFRSTLTYRIDGGKIKPVK